MRADRPGRGQSEHGVADLPVLDPRPDRFDDAGDIVAEDERKCARAFQPEKPTAITGGSFGVDRVDRTRVNATTTSPALASGFGAASRRSRKFVLGTLQTSLIESLIVQVP